MPDILQDFPISVEPRRVVDAGGTAVHFSHRGWPAENPHDCTSTHCWALYLRILRRHLEHSEFVPYALRLDA